MLRSNPLLRLRVIAQQLKDRPKDVFAYEEHWGLTTRHLYASTSVRGITCVPEIHTRSHPRASFAPVACSAPRARNLWRSRRAEGALYGCRLPRSYKDWEDDECAEPFVWFWLVLVRIVQDALCYLHGFGES